MKFYLGVTDNNWYNYLSSINPEDINFWQPGGSSSSGFWKKMHHFFLNFSASAGVPLNPQVQGVHP